MAAVQCDVEGLLINSKCYIDLCAGDGDRDAIQIYADMQNLAASGGTTYNLATLQTAAKAWMRLSSVERHAIETYWTVLNAANNGATIPTGLDSLKAQVRCIQCLGTEAKRNIKFFLRCALNNAGAE